MVTSFAFRNPLKLKVVVRFRSLEKPKEDELCLELSKLHNYDDVVERVARHLGLDDPSKIRLTSRNCYSQQPKAQPIKRLYRRREESKKERESEEELAVAKSILSPHRRRRLAVATVLQPPWPLPLLQPFEENIALYAYVSQREALPSLYSLIGLGEHIKKRPPLATSEKVLYGRGGGRGRGHMDHTSTS
ncbi:hypothetical protein HYC85_008130 [Camellia sinensis]|uniref:Ubiquitin carboxyl-terminal hydrolase 7 ICP0-binding domain-containing protein n=1 Tax=Camellia sinensis TaxID=4442 RepID=A0A7J7HTA8_CAMSI|nr:hypothetical protein HYC85_008130 [Camellia sinensis]